MSMVGAKIDLEELLEQMEASGWTSNAIEYVERAIDNHDALVKTVKNYRERMALDCENTVVKYLDILITLAEGK